MNSKIGFWLRRTSENFRPPASPNLFKLSCFGAASLPKICGAGFAKFPNFEFICVYLLLKKGGIVENRWPYCFCTGSSAG